MLEIIKAIEGYIRCIEEIIVLECEYKSLQHRIIDNCCYQQEYGNKIEKIDIESFAFLHLTSGYQNPGLLYVSADPG